MWVPVRSGPAPCAFVRSGEAEQLLDGLQSSDPQELIASALRKAGTGKAA